MCKSIIGIDNIDTLQLAKESGIIDAYYSDLETSVKDVDLVIIATPVKTINNILTSLKPIWNKNTIYIDVGSTKQNIVNHVLDIFETIPDNLILTHPISGSEKSGLKSSTYNLFQDKSVIITKIYKPNKTKLNKIKKLWELLGSKVIEMNSKKHDEIFAYTSHLPNLISFVYINMLKNKTIDNLSDYTGNGFKDFTRLALSNPKMWSDICMANKSEIASLIEQLINDLSDINTLLKDNKKTELEELFKVSNTIKQNL